VESVGCWAEISFNHEGTRIESERIQKPESRSQNEDIQPRMDANEREFGEERRTSLTADGADERGFLLPENRDGNEANESEPNRGLKQDI
jgi:hypothetical protein